MKILMLICAFLSFNLQAATKRPKLVVLLVIDQFRSDYLTRFKERFLPSKNGSTIGGFNYLMEKGAYFPYAEYDILQSMTGPGHATVLSGAYPYQFGIPLNYWYDTNKNKLTYCVEDETAPIVGVSSKKAAGMSPRNLVGTTLGDEMKNAGYPSKVISIALKDRASILMGGHRADLALWFDAKTFQWVSSKYYLPNDELPSWVVKLNEEINTKKGPVKIWSTKLQETMQTYLTTTNSYPNEKKIIGKIGPVFNHGIQACSPEELTSPYGIELTTETALRALDVYELGKNKTPDLLAVSFSSHDYVGHAFGPNSKEMEDMTVVEDRSISKFLNALDKKVPGGLAEVVVALTADHGAPSNADWLAKNKINAGRINIENLLGKLENAMSDKFGPIGKNQWIIAVSDLNFYFDRDVLKDKKVSLEDAALVVKNALKSEEFVAHVFTSFDYEKHLLPPGMHQRQILKTFYAGRSGDVIAIPKPYYMEDDENSTTHMTGYSYDRTVPLVIMGPGIKGGMIPKQVEVIDLAPTLSILTGIIPPSLSEGRVLTEIFK